MPRKELDTAALNYIEELKANYEQKIHNLEKKVITLENKYLDMKEQQNLLLYKRFMRSAEQIPVDDKQQLLFVEEIQPQETKPKDEKEEARIEVKSHSRKKSGRKPIDPNIPTEEKVIDIPESEKICACGAELSKIGEETSEKLHIIPQRIFAEKTIRPKYACHSFEGTEDEDGPSVRIAAVEPAIIPRSIASASLLSTIFTHKFEDHLPYYR